MGSAGKRAAGRRKSSAASAKPVHRVSILEEHETMRISIRKINDYNAEYLDDSVLLSETETEDEYGSAAGNHRGSFGDKDVCGIIGDKDDYAGTADNHYHHHHHDECISSAKESRDMVTDAGSCAESFRFDDHGVLLRQVPDEKSVIRDLKILMLHHSASVLTEGSKYNYYRLLLKKYASLSEIDFNTLVVLYGLYPARFASVKLNNPCISECDKELLLREVFQLDFDDFEVNFDTWELKARRNIEKGHEIVLKSRLGVKSLQDISLIKMALKCDNCDKPLQPKNISLKAKNAELPITENQRKLTQNPSENYKCEQCSVSFCSQKCLKEKIKLHCDLSHPSLKYKPNVKVDGKKYHALEMKLLNNDLEDVFTLLNLQGVDLPCPKFNILSLPYQNNNISEQLYEEVFHLFKEVFTEYPLNFGEFLNEIGKYHYLNLFKDSETGTIFPVTSILAHSCEEPGVEIHNGKLHFVRNVCKGETIKLDFYNHCSKNISSDAGRYAFLKNNFGIHCTCTRCVSFQLAKRRRSSVRFLASVTAFNIAQ